MNINLHFQGVKGDTHCRTTEYACLSAMECMYECAARCGNIFTKLSDIDISKMTFSDFELIWRYVIWIAKHWMTRKQQQQLTRQFLKAWNGDFTAIIILIIWMNVCIVVQVERHHHILCDAGCRQQFSNTHTHTHTQVCIRKTVYRLAYRIAIWAVSIYIRVYWHSFRHGTRCLESTRLYKCFIFGLFSWVNGMPPHGIGHTKVLKQVSNPFLPYTAVIISLGRRKKLLQCHTVDMKNYLPITHYIYSILQLKLKLILIHAMKGTTWEHSFFSKDEEKECSERRSFQSVEW